jgi:hypothetical protein
MLGFGKNAIMENCGFKANKLFEWRVELTRIIVIPCQACVTFIQINNKAIKERAVNQPFSVKCTQ